MSSGRIPSVEGGIQPTIVDAKGDLIVATAADTVSRLAVGTNDQVLTADSSTATGLKWAAAGGGGKVLQVVQGTYATSKSITSQTWTDTDLSASITPSATSSKILVLVSQTFSTTRNDENCRIGVRLLRSSTTIFGDNSASAGQYTLGVRAVPSTATGLNGVVNFAYLDSPSTTSSTTYKTQYSVDNTSITATAQPNSITSSIILMEIGA